MTREVPTIKAWTLLVTACTLCAAAPAYAAPSNYTTFDPPNSFYTQPECINPAGTIAGYYYDDQTSNSQGFIRSAAGTITSVNVPDAVATEILGLNASGTTTGIFIADNLWHGFVRTAGGAFMTFDPTGSIFTIAFSINDSGLITGVFQDSNYVYHGFLRAADGAITTFDAPNAGTGPYQGTALQIEFSGVSGCSALNNAGVVTGSYADSNYVEHGFVRSASGVITTFDVPGTDINTLPVSISPSGVIGGSYYDAAGVHSFVRSAAGVITTFDPSNASATAPGSFLSGINPAGTVVGYAQLPDSSITAYVRTAAGTTSFLSLPGYGTFGFAINPAGTVTGYYINTDGGLHGFVATAPY